MKYEIVYNAGVDEKQVAICLFFNENYEKTIKLFQSALDAVKWNTKQLQQLKLHVNGVPVSNANGKYYCDGYEIV